MKKTFVTVTQSKMNFVFKSFCSINLIDFEVLKEGLF